MLHREIEIPLANILPIQAAGVSRSHVHSMLAAQALPPVETVLYQGSHGEDNATYLLLDGTHRAYREHILGNRVVTANLATEDEDLAGLTGFSLAGLHTLAQVHDRYETLWQPLLVEAGIQGIADLPLYDSPSAQW